MESVRAASRAPSWEQIKECAGREIGGVNGEQDHAPQVHRGGGRWNIGLLQSRRGRIEVGPGGVSSVRVHDDEIRVRSASRAARVRKCSRRDGEKLIRLHKTASQGLHPNRRPQTTQNTARVRVLRARSARSSVRRTEPTRRDRTSTLQVPGCAVPLSEPNKRVQPCSLARDPAAGTRAHTGHGPSLVRPERVWGPQQLGR